MKNLILISFFTLFSFSLFSQSNIRLGYQGVNYPHFESSFVGPVASIETNMGNRFSLNLNLGLLSDHTVIALGQDIVTRAFKIEPEVRFFPKIGLKGLFIGGRMSYSNFSSKLKTAEESFAYPTLGGEEFVFGVGGVLGFQADFLDRIKLNVTLGLETDSVDGDAMGSISIGAGYQF